MYHSFSEHRYAQTSQLHSFSEHRYAQTSQLNLSDLKCLFRWLLCVNSRKGLWVCTCFISFILDSHTILREQELCFTSFYICVTHIIPYYTISCKDILCPVPNNLDFYWSWKRWLLVNIFGQGENACNQQFLLLLQCCRIWNTRGLFFHG